MNIMTGRKLYRQIGAVLAALLLLLGVSLTSSAQGVLSYGSGVSGTLSAQAPLGFYSFNGNEGDQVTIRVLALTPTLTPTLSVNNPTQAQIALSTLDPFSTGEARISIMLQQTGVYTVIVGGNGTTGDYALRLDGQAAAPSIAVIDQATTSASGTQPQVFTINGNPNNGTIITVSSDTSGFTFAASIRTADGALIGTLNGSDTQAVSVNVPAGNVAYVVSVLPLNPDTTGSVTLLTTPFGSNPLAPPPPPPTVVGDPPLPTATSDPNQVCTVTTTGGNVNVRSGAGTDFDVIATMTAADSLRVVGFSGDWYLIDLGDGNTGWVSQSVIVTSGDCSTVQEVLSPQQPTATSEVEQATPTFTATVVTEQEQATPTFTATAVTEQEQATPTFTATAVTEQEQATPTFTATATFTPSYTPTIAATATPTATYTPSYTPTTQPAAQIAPEDARFNNPLEIPLDNTVSVLDFVSYPGGDREDRVNFSVSGMNNNVALTGGRARLVISASCFGENTDQIQFFTGGQTYTCGQTLVDREVTADSDTGSIVITAIGGEDTYVQWVLTGTATRVN